jgi:hypothetical protein
MRVIIVVTTNLDDILRKGPRKRAFFVPDVAWAVIEHRQTL